MEKNEIRILLNEPNFTQLCKTGFYTHRGEFGKTDVYITKADMKEIATGKILTKEVDDSVIKFALSDIGLVLIREILRRSPIYSEMASDIEFNK